MSQKICTFNLSNNGLELALRDCRNNLEEFVRTISSNVDHSTFDILSLTRTDIEPGYSQHFYHRKADALSRPLPTLTTRAPVIPFDKSKGK